MFWKAFIRCHLSDGILLDKTIQIAQINNEKNWNRCVLYMLCWAQYCWFYIPWATVQSEILFMCANSIAIHRNLWPTQQPWPLVFVLLSLHNGANRAVLLYVLHLYIYRKMKWKRGQKLWNNQIIYIFRSFLCPIPWASSTSNWIWIIITYQPKWHVQLSGFNSLVQFDSQLIPIDFIRFDRFERIVQGIVYTWRCGKVVNGIRWKENS